MKVLVLSQYWHPEDGAPQRRWCWLAEILTRAGHEVFVVAPPPHYARRAGFREWMRYVASPSSENELGPAGESILRSFYVPASNSLTGRVLNQAAVAGGMVAQLFISWKKVREFSPDVIIGTVPALPTAAITEFYSKVLHTPYIIDLRDAWPDLMAESRSWNNAAGKPSLRQKILSLGPLQIVTKMTTMLLNRSLNNASGISVTSDYLRDRLQKRFLKMGADRRSIVTVRNVFPTPVKRSRECAVFEEDRSLRVLYAGTIGRAQNLANAVRAAKIAQEMGYDIKLRMVGAGVAKKEVAALAKQMDVNLLLESKLEPDQVSSLYRWADTCLVHLTSWEALHRAVPSKTYELMHHQIHISGVVAGEAAELIEATGSGFVVTPESPKDLALAWIRLINDRGQLNVGEAGSKWVEGERVKCAEPRFLELLEGILVSE